MNINTSFFRMTRDEEQCYGSFLSCHELEGAITFNYNSITLCGFVHSGNKGMPFVSDYNGGDIPLDKIMKVRNDLRRENQTNHDTPCKGCPFLVRRHWKLYNNLFNHITVAHYTPCNLKCTYCYTTKYTQEEFKKLNTHPYNVTDSIIQMSEKGVLSENTTAWLTGGEPTVFIDFLDIIKVLIENKVRTTIGTNCVKPSLDIVKEGLKNNLIEILCSVDAGTHQIYHMVKGKNCFETVWTHLNEYAHINQELVIVKYIFLESNAIEKEVLNFIYMCKSNNIKKISISHDVTKNSGILSKEIKCLPIYILDLIVLMVYEAIKNKIEVFFDVNWPVFNDFEMNKIKEMLLIKIKEDIDQLNNYTKYVNFPFVKNIDNQLENINKFLGINYSGFHDTSLAIIDKMGNILSAYSLERFTREKQDGKTPEELLKNIDFNEIEEIVITTNKYFKKQEYISKVHPQKLTIKRDIDFSHKKEFYHFIENLPSSNISFIDHELAHAASSFWLSGFDEGICIVYDGGMYNTNIFGGVYKCSKKDGIKLLDGFDINQYAKITTLYTVITAALGFTPNKHEGKITGLAAYGKYDEQCTNILTNWFVNKYDELESSLEWIFSYSQKINPIFHKNSKKIVLIKESFKTFDKETIAFNLQLFTENHILRILENMYENNLLHKNICLAGGLFANVKINQKIADFKDFKFENIFIAPPMGDEGTALGAALHAVNNKYNITDFSNSMYLGDSYTPKEILNVLDELNVMYKIVDNPSEVIANILASGNEVALFDLRMEFGPRALGARSILAPANDKTINERLNKKLNRTEFMPFAPMTLEEYLDKSYINFENKKLAMKFMTIACDCTDWMSENMSAVVHIDNTARPQIITKDNKFLYELMYVYNRLTGLSSIVNTSFNIHEEPIINTPYEAVKGMLISGLDYLFFKEANILVKYEDNKDLAFVLVKERMIYNKLKEEQHKQLVEYFENQNDVYKKELIQKELVINDLNINLLRAQDELVSFKQNIFIKILNKLGLIK